jgi:hypothetical protein
MFGQSANYPFGTGRNSMTHTITLELPEALYAALSKAAQQSGTSPSEWIVSNLNKHLAPRHNKPGPSSDYTGEEVKPSNRTPGNHGDNEEQKKARERFRRHFGEVNSGDPRSADNDRIDADLARSYTDSAPKDT